MSFYTVLNFFSTLILFFVSAWSAIKAMRSCGRPDMAAPVVFVLLAIFALPVFLDWTVGIPHYGSILAAMDDARFDDLTNSIYNVYISFAIVLFSRNIGNIRLCVRREEFESFLRTVERFSIPLLFFAFLPFFLLPFVSSIKDFTTFGVERVYQEYYSWVDAFLPKSCIVSVFCVMLLWILNQKKGAHERNIFLFIIILFDCLFEGKRSLFFLACLLYLGLNYFYGMSFGRLLRRAIVGSLLFAAFFIGYGKNTGGSSAETYATLRAYLGRDDVTKYTLKKVLVDGDSILEYPGQSFVFWGTVLIPRRYWSEKPWPYAVYFTNSLLPEHVRLRRIAKGEETLGWGMTTSIAEEFIANFRWLGVLFPVAALAGLFFIQRFAFIPRCIAYSIFILLLAIHFIAIYPFYIMLFAGILIWRSREYPRLLLERVHGNKK